MMNSDAKIYNCAAPANLARNRSVKLCRWPGFSYIEVLVASVICVLSFSVMIQLWSVSMNISVRGADKAVAYNLERQTLEQVIETGFTNTPEALAAAPITHYFDVNLNSLDATPAAARYVVKTTVVSSSTVSGSNPTAPAPAALRLVTVTVTLVPTNTLLSQISTYLTRGGI